MPDLLFASLEAVVDETTFLAFIAIFTQDRAAAESLPISVDGRQGEWANQSILAFLEAGHAWAEDSGFGQRPGPPSHNPWQLFASFLWAGRGYE